jgi:hypothetical protein
LACAVLLVIFVLLLPVPSRRGVLETRAVTRNGCDD